MREQSTGPPAFAPRLKYEDIRSSYLLPPDQDENVELYPNWYVLFEKSLPIGVRIDEVQVGSSVVSIGYAAGGHCFLLSSDLARMARDPACEQFLHDVEPVYRSAVRENRLRNAGVINNLQAESIAYSYFSTNIIETRKLGFIRSLIMKGEEKVYAIPYILAIVGVFRPSFIDFLVSKYGTDFIATKERYLAALPVTEEFFKLDPDYTGNKFQVLTTTTAIVDALTFEILATSSLSDQTQRVEKPTRRAKALLSAIGRPTNFIYVQLPQVWLVDPWLESSHARLSM